MIELFSWIVILVVVLVMPLYFFLTHTDIGKDKMAQFERWFNK